MVIALAFVCAAAHAESTPVRIEYTAPASCPDQAELERRVKERLQRARLAEPGEMARTFRITVTSKPERSVARVEFVDADGEKVSRTLGADSCDEVVNAIALVTALAMEARAGAEAPEPEPGASPAPSVAPTTPIAPRQPPPPVKPKSDSGPRWDAGMGVDLASGYAPSLSVGLHLFVELMPSFWSVRVSAMHADSGKVNVEGGRTRFRFWGGRVEGCPLRWRFEQHFGFVPCAGIEAGALHGEGLPGREIVFPDQATEPWLAVVAIARLQADVEEFLLLELAGDLRVPLLQHEFYLDRPIRSAHEVPPLAFGVSLGVGFRFE
jgi:hypothetical protein